MSELGSYLDGCEGLSDSAPAGTKRVGKLLPSVKWTVKLIDRYLLEQADAEAKRLKGQGQRILCVWDGACWKKRKVLN